MAEKINLHVERLGRFLPFSPAHDQIYEEYQQTNDSLSLETAAFGYLLGVTSWQHRCRRFPEYAECWRTQVKSKMRIFLE